MPNNASFFDIKIFCYVFIAVIKSFNQPNVDIYCLMWLEASCYCYCCRYVCLLHHHIILDVLAHTILLSPY